MAETLHCAVCGAENPNDARFCIECGAAMTPASTGPTIQLPSAACPTCGGVNPEEARFCVYCGRTLQAAPPAPKLSAPRVDVPRQQLPSMPPLPSTPPPARPQAGPSFAPMLVGLMGFVMIMVLMIGSAGVMRSGRALFPLGALMIGAIIVIGALTRRGGMQNPAWLIWPVGMIFLLATGLWWPGILVLVVLSMLANGGRRRRHGRW